MKQLDFKAHEMSLSAEVPGMEFRANPEDSNQAQEHVCVCDCVPVIYLTKLI
jgi:hypothetical protein